MTAANDITVNLLETLAVVDVIAKLGVVIAGVWVLSKALGWIHQKKSRLPWVLVGIFVVAGAATHFGVKHLERTRAESRAGEIAEARKPRRAPSGHVREATASAVDAERNARANLVETLRPEVERLRELTGQAFARWPSYPVAGTPAQT